MGINAKLSDLTESSALASGALIYIVEGGNSRKKTLSTVSADVLNDTGHTAVRTSIGLPPANTIAEMTAIAESALANTKYVMVSDVARGGVFKVLSGTPAANGLTANSGTVFASDGGGYTFRRIYEGPVVLRWFAGDGVDITDGATNAASVLTSVLSSFDEVRLTPGTYLLSADVTVASGKRLVLDAGALFAVGNTFTLTVNAPLHEKNYQIFDVSAGGTVDGTFGGEPIRPYWWGLATDGTTKTAGNDTLFDAAVTAAISAGVPLEFDNISVKRHAAKTYTASGTYDWRNVNIVKEDATGSADSFVFQGSAFGSEIALTADAAVEDTSVTVATGLSITAEDRYLIISTADYNTDAGSNTAQTSEYVSVASYNSGTGALSLSSQLQSAYATANGAAVLKCNFSDMIVKITGKMTGGGAALAQTAVKCIRCDVQKIDLFIDDFEKRGMWLDECTGTQGPLYATGKNIDQSGFGYLWALSGCDHIQIGDVNGTRIRHAISCGGGAATLTVNSTSVVPLGGLVQAGNVHVQDAISSLVDTHASIRSFQCGNIAGNMIVGSTQPCVTVQSNDAAFGDIHVDGWDQAGVLVQYLGRPAGEVTSHIKFGKIVVNAGGDGSDHALAIENKNPTEEAPLVVTFDALIARCPGGLYINNDASSGDVYVVGKYVWLRSDTTHSIYLDVDAADGRLWLDLQFADIYNDASSTSIYGIYNLASTYTTAHTGEPGGYVKISSGRVERSGAGTYAFRAVDGIIDIGTDILVISPNFKLNSGVGDVYRPDRTAATS